VLLKGLKKNQTHRLAFQKHSYISFELKTRTWSHNQGRMPKSQTSRPNQNQPSFIMETNPQSNPLAGLAKQRLYSLIVAGVGLISIFLPWVTIRYGGFSGGSVNGLHSWGLISVIGVGVVAAACFMGNKAAGFDANGKKMAMAGFGAMVVGALLFFLRINSFGGGISSAVHAGLGLWICIAAGLAGLAWVMGFIKMK
jgi:hypothetical protein